MSWFWCEILGLCTRRLLDHRRTWARATEPLTLKLARAPVVHSDCAVMERLRRHQIESSRTG